jgi:hypothetical protein
VRATDDEWSAHWPLDAPPSAIVAATVTDKEPTEVHVKVGDAPFVLLKVPAPGPPVTAHERSTSVLPFASMPFAPSWILPPTSTSDGLAESDVTAAHWPAIVVPPPIVTEPVSPASPPPPPPMHRAVTVTAVVAFGVTSKEALPVQDSPPTSVFPLTAID